MNEPGTLVLTETGVEHLPDGSLAVNVGPIIRALKFLTEGAGEDRGIDEQGNPLPDLMSLAFEVIESIIVGGRKADVFRQVKRELDAQIPSARSSVTLAKVARRVVPTAQATALDQAADTLQGLLRDLRELSLGDEGAHQLSQSLEAFRSFGADRWVSATAQLLVAARALGVVEAVAQPKKRATKRRPKPAARPPESKRRKAPAKNAKAKAEANTKPKRKPKRQRKSR